jgi:hypothetical protein
MFVKMNSNTLAVSSATAIHSSSEKAIELNDNFTYHRLWYVGFGGDQEALARSEGEGQWQTRLREFMSKRIGEDDLLGYARTISDASQTINERRCEAYTYIGLRNELQKNEEKSRRSYQAAISTNIVGYVEYRWSVERLRQEDGTTSTGK